jgi:HEAT repeat protein
VAQQALCEIARAAELDAELRESATMQLALLEQPTQETVAALRDLTESDLERVGNAAALALGAAAGKLVNSTSEAERSQASGVIAALASKLTASGDAREQARLLAALGNAGSAESLDEIVPFLSHPSPHVRERATTALARIDDPRVDGLLVSIMTRDPDGGVRQAAVATAGTRPPSQATTPVIEKVLRGDEDAAVRLAAVGALRHSIHLSNVRETLTWVEANDPDSGVRSAAKSALAPRG